MLAADIELSRLHSELPEVGVALLENVTELCSCLPMLLHVKIRMRNGAIAVRVEGKKGGGRGGGREGGRGRGRMREGERGGYPGME